ncbi:uncharacterized protein LOC134812977 [Bolinopsis microptera]|uniref:uncharacterized protein LOC134812977 n=1 Tax=Bolinopsis microptera TaxID=2820187 RepID=UPI00307A89AE
MKIFVLYNGRSIPWQIGDAQTVDQLKESIRTKYQLDPQQNIRLLHSGADLSGPWIIRDVGIPYGASLHCRLREQEPIPNLHIMCNYNGQKIDLYDVDVVSLTIFQLQEVVMYRTGLPLGCFRLADGLGREMFSKHSCNDYGVLPGATIYVQVWKGWSALINTTFEGNIPAVQNLLDEDKAVRFYQMKVVMFLAAHLGLLELAEDMLNGGVRADEPVGYHPGKKWCSDRSDPTHHLYAVHKATEEGRLELLRLFMSRYPCSIIVQNYKGQNALAIATEKGHTECITHINTKQSKPQVLIPELVGAPHDTDYLYRNYCLVMKVKQWHALGKDKVALMSKRTSDGSFNTKSLETRKSQVLPSQSDKAMHIDGLIHFRCRTCPAKLAERPISSLSDRRAWGAGGRSWSPSAKTREMKRDVLSQGLHWDTTQHSSGKVEFTDLLFTPKKSTPVLPNVSRNTKSSDSPQMRKKTASSSPTSSVASSKGRRTVKAIEDYNTGMWVHNGLTAREKAAACIEMSDTYNNKTWMSKFRIALSVNESTLKRKLKEGTPVAPIARNEQGILYRRQFYRNRAKVSKGANFAADWTNGVDSREAKSRTESRAFRNRGGALLREKSTVSVKG